MENHDFGNPNHSNCVDKSSVPSNHFSKSKRTTMHRKTIKDIQKNLCQGLFWKGIATENIKVKEHYTRSFKRETIDAQKDNINFRIGLFTSSVEYAQQRHMPNDEAFLRYTLFFFVNNPHKLQLSLKRENIKSKLGKLFGKHDLETYNHDFDKSFLIEGNHSYAHAELLDEQLQKQLLQLKGGFTELLIQAGFIRYTESLVSTFFTKVHENRILDFVDAGLKLAQNLEAWNPLDEIE